MRAPPRLTTAETAISLSRSSTNTAKTQGLRCVARSCWLVIATLVSCIVAANIIGLCLYFLKPAIFLEPKKLYEAAADGRTDTLFFGSSRIEDGIIPQIFDDSAQNQHIGDLHAYNVASPGSPVYEIFSELQTLFYLRPKGIKFVFIEPDMVTQYLVMEPNTARAIDYFTFEHAYWTLKLTDAADFQSYNPPLSKRRYLSNVAGAVLRHYFDIGLAWAKAESSPDFSPTARGFPDRDNHEYEIFTADEAYYSGLKQITLQQPQPDRISDTKLDFVLSLAAFVRQHGAVPILIRAPLMVHWDLAADFVAKFAQRCTGKGPLLFDFGLPNENPALWDPQNRQNEDHLNAAGAAIFTRLIAARLAAAIKDNSISRPLCQATER